MIFVQSPDVKGDTRVAMDHIEVCSISRLAVVIGYRFPLVLEM